MNRILSLVFLLAGGCLAAAAHAQDLSIRADQTLVEDGGARKILRGDVVIEFNRFSFTADEVIQHFDGEEPVRYEASGDPVRVTQAGESMTGLEEGTADTLEYLVQEKTLLLTNYELRFSGGIVQRGREFKMVFP